LYSSEDCRQRDKSQKGRRKGRREGRREGEKSPDTRTLDLDVPKDSAHLRHRPLERNSGRGLDLILIHLLNEFLGGQIVLGGGGADGDHALVGDIQLGKKELVDDSTDLGTEGEREGGREGGRGVGVKLGMEKNMREKQNIDST